MKKLSYQNSGVDREQGDALVGAIQKMLHKNSAKQILLKKHLVSSVGGYASVYKFSKTKWLAISTDGVGTKLKLAFETGIHHTVGIDLVAMSVNDLLCVGATPELFLDYFATGKLLPRIAEKVLEGIVEGCRQAGCLLVGGETAEMPGLYEKGEYDLAGFATGSLNPKDFLPRREQIQAGDVLIGLPSSGFHSNGFSLVRKWLEGASAKDRKRRIQQALTPTRIYVDSVNELLKVKSVRGLAHITGSGFLNVPRISEAFHYEINLPPVNETPQVYQERDFLDAIEFQERVQTFNMGVGMVICVAKKDSENILKLLKRGGERAFVLGEVSSRVGKNQRPHITVSQIISRTGRSSRESCRLEG